MVTGLFLRSYERGERVYVAMVARGYAGRCRACRCWRSGAPTPCSSMQLALTLVPLRVLAEVAS